jgi:hypothetical protein
MALVLDDADAMKIWRDPSCFTSAYGGNSRRDAASVRRRISNRQSVPTYSHRRRGDAGRTSSTGAEARRRIRFEIDVANSIARTSRLFCHAMPLTRGSSPRV